MNILVYILVQIDDEYGHMDFKGVFSSRSAGEAFVKESKELSLKVKDWGLYTSMEEFNKKNGCEGLVLFSTQIMGETIYNGSLDIIAGTISGDRKYRTFLRQLVQEFKLTNRHLSKVIMAETLGSKFNLSPEYCSKVVQSIYK